MRGWKGGQVDGSSHAFSQVFTEGLYVPDTILGTGVHQ